jgi:hypothetical protein
MAAAALRKEGFVAVEAAIPSRVVQCVYESFDTLRRDTQCVERSSTRTAEWHVGCGTTVLTPPLTLPPALPQFDMSGKRVGSIGRCWTQRL